MQVPSIFDILSELPGGSRASRTLTLLSGLFLMYACAHAQISLVHVTACGPQTFPASTCAIPSTGNGNLLVVAWASNNGGGATTIASVTDNASNVYSEAGSARAVDSGPNTTVDIWYARNSVSGATVLTVTPNPTGTSGTALVWEFSGANTTAPLDQTAVLNSQAATTTPSGASLTTTAGEVVISTANVQGAVSGILSGNSFVSDSTANGDGWAHVVTPSAGTYMAQWSNAGTGTFCSSSVSFQTSSGGSGGSGGAAGACDLNQDGVVNVLDVQLATNMDLGLIPCTADIDGGLCNSTVVQRVVNAALGSACVVTHTVTLNWTASISSNIAGYNVYRSTASGGSYTKLNSSLVAGTSYLDSTVQSGTTYYYVTTAVDTSNDESAYSNQAQAVVPTP
jgi:hypothetical protein